VSAVGSVVSAVALGVLLGSLEPVDAASVVWAAHPMNANAAASSVAAPMARACIVDRPICGAMARAYSR
jgi:hypothetical protein